jgi:hypothetical protein
MNQLAIALLGSGGFIGSHVAQFCLESGIPIIELPRWEGNRKKFDEKIRELKLMHPQKRIVFLQAAWYSTNNSDYRSSSENHEWVKTTKLILEIWTDGTMKASEALIESAKILLSYFGQIVTPKKVKKVEEVVHDELGLVGKLSVEEVGLPTSVVSLPLKKEQCFFPEGEQTFARRVCDIED